MAVLLRTRSRGRGLRSSRSPLQDDSIPYVFNGSSGVTPNRASPEGYVITGFDDSGSIPRSPYIFPRTQWRMALSYGQSLSLGAEALPALTTTPSYSNIMPAGGLKAQFATGSGAIAPFNNDPSAWATTTGLVSDNLDGWNSPSITGEGHLYSAIHGATEYARDLKGIATASNIWFGHCPGRGGIQIAVLNANSGQWAVLTRALQEAKALADAAGKTFSVAAVQWIQGESDTLLVIGTSYATYKALLIQMSIDINSLVQSITGQRQPCFLQVYQTAHFAGSPTTPDGRIAWAQYDAARECPLIQFVTPIYHIAHFSDNLHLTAPGSQHMGDYFGKALYQACDAGVTPEFLRPMSAIYTARQIAVKFSVPTPPLVIDTSTWAAATQNGFRAIDDTGDIALSGFSISGSDKLVMNTGRDPNGILYIQMASDYLSPSITDVSSGASANVRDSGADLGKVSGQPIWHMAPSCRLVVQQ